MLLKAPDDETAQLADWEQFATVASPARRRQILEERRILRSGIKGEQESAGLLDFDFMASRNTAIIHDLRLKVNDRVAQIDQLLLHRTLNVFALETKHFTAGVKSTEEGEFLRWNPSAKTYEGMPSPLAQNERHTAALKDAFERIDIPTRLGIRLTPVVLSYVLVSPRARSERPERFDTSHVLRADMFSAEDELNRRGLLKGIGHISRFVSSSTLREIGRQLVSLHRPATIDYAARFGTSSAGRARAAHAPSGTQARRAAIVPTPRPAIRRKRRPTCQHCGSDQLTLQSGRIGFQFTCAACNQHSPLEIACGKPGHRERIRPDGRTLYRACPACRTRAVFIVNPGKRDETCPSKTKRATVWLWPRLRYI